MAFAFKGSQPYKTFGKEELYVTSFSFDFILLHSNDGERKGEGG